MASYLQRYLSAQVNGGPDATTDHWKQPFSAVRASGGCPGNENRMLPQLPPVNRLSWEHQLWQTPYPAAFSVNDNPVQGGAARHYAIERLANRACQECESIKVWTLLLSFFRYFLYTHTTNVTRHIIEMLGKFPSIQILQNGCNMKVHWLQISVSQNLTTWCLTVDKLQLSLMTAQSWCQDHESRALQTEYGGCRNTYRPSSFSSSFSFSLQPPLGVRFQLRPLH